MSLVPNSHTVTIEASYAFWRAPPNHTKEMETSL